VESKIWPNYLAIHCTVHFFLHWIADRYHADSDLKKDSYSPEHKYFVELFFFPVLYRYISLFVCVVRYSSSEEGGAIHIRSGSTSTISTGRRTDRLTDNRYRAAVLLTQDVYPGTPDPEFHHPESRSRIPISDPGSQSQILDPDLGFRIGKRQLKSVGGGVVVV
jgi:hypothetical protein